MYPRAALKSSTSPLPPLNDPALRPTPRKLKRSTAQPVRASPFVPWYTALVCIVPPNCGCGCANTTAARSGSRAGSSRSASSGPAGPERSEIVAMDEPTDDGGEAVRVCEHTQVAGARHQLVTCVRDERGIAPGVRHRHDAIELGLAADDERRSRYLPAVLGEIQAQGFTDPLSHQPGDHRGRGGTNARPDEELEPRSRVRIRGAHLRPQPEGCRGNERRSTAPRALHPALLLMVGTPARGGSRGEHERADPRIARRRVAHRYESSEGDAADLRPLDPGHVEDFVELVYVAVESGRAPARADVTAQRVRDHAAVRSEPARRG